MLAPSWFYVGSVGLMLAYAGFMLAYVGSCWVKLVHVGSSWPKLSSRCVYVVSSWPQDVLDGLPRSPKGQISSMLDPKLFILEHPESSKYSKKHVFYRSVCNLHFFVSRDAFWVSKLAQVLTKLAHVGLLEQI